MVMGSRSLGRVIFGLITTRSLVALMGLLILNYFTHHNEVMLLGHSDTYTRDKVMQVTFAYNHFGRGLIQRMPRYILVRTRLYKLFYILSIYLCKCFLIIQFALLYNLCFYNTLNDLSS